MEKLSNTEQYLWDFIEDNPDQVTRYSISKLSELANVSTATIVRTMKKMGYSGYTDFRQKFFEKSSNPDLKYNILAQVNSEIRKVILNNEAEVHNTIQLLDKNIIEDSVQEVMTAKSIYIFARGFSTFIASEMLVKLQLLNKFVQANDDPNIIRTISKDIKPNSVVLFITLNGNTQELVDAAKILQRHDVPTITFTTNSQGEIVKYSDLVFLGYKSKTTYFPEYEVNSRLPLQIMTRILTDALALRIKNLDVK